MPMLKRCIDSQRASFPIVQILCLLRCNLNVLLVLKLHFHRRQHSEKLRVFPDQRWAQSRAAEAFLSFVAAWTLTNTNIGWQDGSLLPRILPYKECGLKQATVGAARCSHTHIVCVNNNTHSRNSIKNIPWKSYRSIFLSQKNSSVLRKVYSDEKTLGVVYHFDTLSTKHSSHFVAIQHLYLNRYNQGINYWFSI